MKKLLVILLAALMLFALVACAAPANETPADPPQPEDPADTPAQADGTDDPEDPEDPTDITGEIVQLRFMDVIPNPARTEEFQRMINIFNAQPNGIEVTLESTPWDQAHQNLVILGAAGNMPDIFYMHPTWISEFILAEWVLDITEYYENFKYKDILLPFVREVLIEYDQISTRGGVFGMPKGLTTHGMYVRTDWIEEAGMTLEDLETWDGIFRAAEALTDPAQGRFGFTMRGGRLGGEQMGMFVLSALGGRIFDENGVAQFNTPEGIAAIQRFGDIYFNGWAPEDSVNWGFTETVQSFTTGVTGILNQTTGTVSAARDAMEDGTWTVLPFPRAANGNIYCKADAFLLAMGANSPNSAEAFEFITFLISPEQNLSYGKVNSYIPVVEGAADDPFFNEGVFSGFVRSMNDPNFVRQPFYGYFPEVSEFMEIVYDTEFQRFLLGMQTAEEFANLISEWLTEHQQAFMAENPDIAVPMPRGTN